MLDIVKYLKKMNIEIIAFEDKSITVKIEKEVKEINRKKLEQFLFICLTDYIKEA